MAERFFEHFDPDEPMEAISEQEARRRATYAELIDAPMTHYRAFLHRELSHVIYPESQPSSSILSFHTSQYGEVPVWLVSPVSSTDDGTRYDIWFYDSPSAAPRRVRYEVSPGRMLETYFDEHGQLRSTLERRYEADYTPIETIERDATGRIVSIDD